MSLNIKEITYFIERSLLTFAWCNKLHLIYLINNSGSACPVCTHKGKVVYCSMWYRCMR